MLFEKTLAMHSQGLSKDLPKKSLKDQMHQTFLFWYQN